MKTVLYILSTCLLSMVFTLSVHAQGGESEYLFKDFQQSLVYYKDGRVFKVKLNYSLARNAFMFIDENDKNNVKLFAEPEMVRVLKIDNRTFQLTPKGLAQEHLNQDPYLAVTYRGRSRPQGKQVGYGGRSETASVDSYSSIQSAGHIFKLETEKIIIADVQKRYTTKRNGKEKAFETSKQFLKLYPKEQQETIQKYIKTQKTDFDDPQQVLELVKYAEAL